MDVEDPAFTVFSQTHAVTGAYYHVSAVKTATTFSIYVNGVLEDTRALPSFTDSNSANLLIGANALEGAHLNGLIDEVEIFNRALSASEIQAIAHAERGKCKATPTPRHRTPTPTPHRSYADTTTPRLRPSYARRFSNQSMPMGQVSLALGAVSFR